ncbi:MAG TPA: hypothetical protein VLJ58_21275 [Ramlibacter sp.]|nr:hypothetical protein [Ramlibacter sp.]
MASFVITVVDHPDGARVEFTLSEPMPAPDVPLTNAQTVAVAMLYAAYGEASGVTRNDGLLELLKEANARN